MIEGQLESRKAGVRNPSLSDSSSVAIRSAYRLVDLRDHFGGVFDLHYQPLVGLALHIDHDRLVRVAVHVVEADSRYMHARYSPTPPQFVLDVGVCFRTSHMF